ncbi:MAG: hypothetical protein SFW07_05280 [Gammaproteobacteria bacterium]|nr:hypothetical protein [Gammaproteobacteria bacterium]
MFLLLAIGLLVLLAVVWPSSQGKGASPKPTALFELSNPTHILVGNAPPLLGSTFTAITRNEFEQHEKITWTNSPVTYPNTLRHLGVAPQKDPTIVDGFNDFVICDIHPSVGKGVFATKRIPKKTIIGIYTGIVEIALGVGSPYALNAKLRNQPPFYYDATRFRNATSYIQHAPETEIISGMATANIDMQNSIYGGVPLMLYVTTRDIEPHEQLLVNYGNDYWKKRKPKFFNIRGEIIKPDPSLR